MSRYVTFEAAGLGALEEEIYDLLLDAQGLTLDELSRIRPEPSPLLADAFGRLEASGLVARGGTDTPHRYVPTPPDLAIEALVLRRHGELEQLRAHGVTLARRYWSAVDRSGETSVVQVVRGAESVRQHAIHVQRAARHEVLIVERPPYVDGAVPFNDEEIVGLGRGVGYRCIYEAGLLADTEKVAEVFRYVDAGEQARVYSDPPLKLLIADAEVAVVPLDLDEPSSHDCAIVRGPSLITALMTCFEAMWARSVPLSTGIAAPTITFTESAPDDRLSTLEGRIVRMLAAGIKDDAIARQLDVSSRTINRYMDRIMHKLGATTRFQAGLQAARHGLL